MARVLKGSHVSFTCTPRVHPLKRTIPAFCFESLCLVLAVCLRVFDSRLKCQDLGLFGLESQYLGSFFLFH